MFRVRSWPKKTNDEERRIEMEGSGEVKKGEWVDGGSLCLQQLLEIEDGSTVLEKV